MKNTMKVALGFALGGSLILLNELRKKKKEYDFIAPDGNEYQNDEMYRNAEGEIFKNGGKLHFETPNILVEANDRIGSHLNKNTYLNNQNPIERNVNYHKRGVRHH